MPPASPRLPLSHWASHSIVMLSLNCASLRSITCISKPTVCLPPFSNAMSSARSASLSRTRCRMFVARPFCGEATVNRTTDNSRSVFTPRQGQYLYIQFKGERPERLNLFEP
jgi:hypothetical protein